MTPARLSQLKATSTVWPFHLLQGLHLGRCHQHPSPVSFLTHSQCQSRGDPPGQQPGLVTLCVKHSDLDLGLEMYS